MRGNGRVYQRGDRWWIDYSVRGKRFREAAGEKEKDALKKLKTRLKEIAGDRFIGPLEERLTVEELLDSLITHLKTKGAKAIPSVESHLKPVREFFAFTRVVDLSAGHIEDFMKARLEEEKANATINREIGALKQALHLARKQGRLGRIPYIPMLREDNARQGFFERAEFESMASHLPDPVNDIARFAYLSGWRKGEILPLRWDAVEWDKRTGEPLEARLWTSKNGQGRVLPLAGDLAALMKRRKTLREYKAPDGVTQLSEYVFHRRGKPLRDFKKSWSTACEKAKLSGKLFHDLRRTAVRDLIRAGVPQAVAMKITGHRTASVFTRYNIVSGDDMRDAMQRTQNYREELTEDVPQKVVSFPSEKKSE